MFTRKQIQGGYTFALDVAATRSGKAFATPTHPVEQDEEHEHAKDERDSEHANGASEHVEHAGLLKGQLVEKDVVLRQSNFVLMF